MRCAQSCLTPMASAKFFDLSHSWNFFSWYLSPEAAKPCSAPFPKHSPSFSGFLQALIISSAGSLSFLLFLHIIPTLILSLTPQQLGILFSMIILSLSITLVPAVTIIFYFITLWRIISFNCHNNSSMEYILLPPLQLKEMRMNRSFK